MSQLLPPTPNLCEYCSTISIPEVNDGHPHVFYHRSLHYALDAANSIPVCDLCEFLVATCSDSLQHADIREIQLRMAFEDEIISKRYNGNFRVIRLAGVDLDFDICEVSSQVDSGSQCLRYSLDVGSSQLSANGEHAYVPRMTQTHPQSSATVGLVQDWLAACCRHERCSSQRSQRLPHRVIDVQSPTPRIIDTGDGLGCYVALSHCWGSAADTFSTTADNLGSRLIGLDLTGLPLNFQHAIEFTQLLGYQYLWIDSLCILQDDLTEWRYEAAHMAGYYSNAALTLAIADTADCHGGFLEPRSTTYSPPIPGNDGVTVYRLRKRLASQYQIDVSSPISRRAWTLQERILSPRIIHFAKDQLLWRCRSCTWSEGYVTNDLPYERLPADMAGNYLDRNRNLQTHEFSLAFAVRLWDTCVAEYSTRALTRESDKLPAIAGLAARFAHEGLGRYMAGLWEHSLFSGLIWTRIDSDMAMTSCSYHTDAKAREYLRTESTDPPARYRAPSWSWAAVNGPVQVPLDVDFAPSRRVDEHWKSIFGPRLVGSNLPRSRDGDYIDVLEGSYIEIKGFYRALYVLKGSPPPASGALESQSFISKVSLDVGTPNKHFHFDVRRPLDSNAQLGGELFMMQIYKSAFEDGFVFALVLEKVGEPNHFKRVGTAQLQGFTECASAKDDQHNKVSEQSEACWYDWQRDRWMEGILRIF